MKGGRRWLFDFTALNGFEKSKPYLIKVKTGRAGKYKHGLKENRDRRSRRGRTKEDIEEAKRLRSKLFLVNAQLIENWTFAVTSREP